MKELIRKSLVSAFVLLSIGCLYVIGYALHGCTIEYANKLLMLQVAAFEFFCFIVCVGMALFFHKYNAIMED